MSGSDTAGVWLSIWATTRQTADNRIPMKVSDCFQRRIYNYTSSWRKTFLKKGFVFKSTCDTGSSSGTLSRKKRGKSVSKILDECSLRLETKETGNFLRARPVRRKTFFYALLHDGALYFASEMKALVDGRNSKINNRMLLIIWRAVTCL